jgi:hypothetical protein
MHNPWADIVLGVWCIALVEARRFFQRRADAKYYAQGLRRAPLSAREMRPVWLCWLILVPSAYVFLLSIVC